MARNKMSDLRDHLFETLEALKDEDKLMDLDRAKTISIVAQTIIDSAKTEIALLKVIGTDNHSEFFEVNNNRTALDRPASALAKLREVS